MRTDPKTARKIGALYFDENTILEVKQLGGGGSGVGEANGLNARNLVTGEDTGEVIAAQAGQIEEQGAQIETLTAQNTELQAENTQLQAKLEAAVFCNNRAVKILVQNNTAEPIYLVTPNATKIGTPRTSNMRIIKIAAGAQGDSTGAMITGGALIGEYVPGIYNNNFAVIDPTKISLTATPGVTRMSTVASALTLKIDWNTYNANNILLNVNAQ